MIFASARRSLLSSAIPSSATSSKIKGCYCCATIVALSFLSTSATTAAAKPTTTLSSAFIAARTSPLLSTTIAAATTGGSSLSSSLFSSKSQRHQAMSTTTTTTATCPSSTSASPSFTVAQFPCRSDNYGYLIHHEGTGQTAAIDTPDAAAYRKVLRERGWKLSHIFNTHHHYDHVGGNMELKTPGVVVYGPLRERDQIPGIDVTLDQGDEVEFGDSKGTVIDVGGHTAGHIAYYFPEDNTAFVGDALFALGCGKMFEGTPSQFWDSLLRLRALPDETVIYCAHEYTQSNAKFALSVEPGNGALVERAAQIDALRAQGKPTVPSLLGLEKRTNPFLRSDVSDEIRNKVGVTANDSPATAFGKVRRAKDQFRG